MIRTIRFTTLGVAFFVSAVTAQGQSSPSPNEEGPIGCLMAAKRYETEIYKAAQAAKTPFDAQGTHAKALEQAKQCGAKFDLETMDPLQRPALGFLYMSVDDVARAKTVLARAERDLPADSTARVTALLQIMQSYGGNSDQSVALADCQRIVRRIDSLPGLHSQKLSAHGWLIAWANNADLDVLARENVGAVLALVPVLTPDEQRANARILVGAYSTRAAHEANALHPDSALLTLAAASRALSNIPDLASAFELDVKRYSMVGKPAPAINAEYWINSPAKPLQGIATVLMFTANWCHSCKTSYPAIVAAMEAYPSPKLQTVFTINLEGQFQGAQMTPAQEVEANRKYFTKDRGFTNPIALQQMPSGEMVPDATSNAVAYAMNYLPQVVIIDQKGIVRAVLQGWDEGGNRERSFRAALDAIFGKKKS